MKNEQTIKVILKIGGEIKIIWTTLGDKKDMETFKNAIDKAFDEVEDAHTPKDY